MVWSRGSLSRIILLLLLTALLPPPSPPLLPSAPPLVRLLGGGAGALPLPFEEGEPTIHLLPVPQNLLELFLQKKGFRK